MLLSLTPRFAGESTKYVALHLHYDNSWTFSITVGVEGGSAPAMLSRSPAEFPVTIAVGDGL